MWTEQELVTALAKGGNVSGQRAYVQPGCSLRWRLACAVEGRGDPQVTHDTYGVSQTGAGNSWGCS